MSTRRRRAMRQWALWALSVCAFAGALLPTWAVSAAPDEEAKGTLDRAVRFLQEAQNRDGGFGGEIGGASDPGFSSWAAYALAAAGINPQDQSQAGGVDVFTYLTRNTEALEQTTDFDRVALVAIASDTSPFQFGPVRPIERMLECQLPDGSFTQKPGQKQGWVNATAWSIFPLSAIEAPWAEESVARAARWLIDNQRSDGGWGWGAGGDGGAVDTDTTGAVIQALNAAGMHGTEAERRAFELLAEMQGPDGGFRATPTTATNSATTAWVIQGMWSAGVDPREWKTAPQPGESSDPLKFLASLQHADGSIGWTETDDMNSLWMTAQTGPALAGLPYPLPPVPRAQKPPEREEDPGAVDSRQRHSSHEGHGGKGFQRGDGVIAGGGGRGADLFSAPAPQSGGSTPNGDRQPDATPADEPEPDRSEPRPVAEEQGTGNGGRAGFGSGAEGGARAGTVEGVLVADTGAPSAPGLFGADSGGSTGTRVTLGLLAALLAAAALGARVEAGA